MYVWKYGSKLTVCMKTKVYRALDASGRLAERLRYASAGGAQKGNSSGPRMKEICPQLPSCCSSLRSGMSLRPLDNQEKARTDSDLGWSVRIRHIRSEENR